MTMTKVPTYDLHSWKILLWTAMWVTWSKSQHGLGLTWWLMVDLILGHCSSLHFKATPIRWASDNWYGLAKDDRKKWKSLNLRAQHTWRNHPESFWGLEWTHSRFSSNFVFDVSRLGCAKQSAFEYWLKWKWQKEWKDDGAQNKHTLCRAATSAIYIRSMWEMLSAF